MSAKVPMIEIEIVAAIDKSSWSAWIAHLTDRGRNDLVDAANAHGKMLVTRRWPQSNSPLPRLTPHYTSRKTGDR